MELFEDLAILELILLKNLVSASELKKELEKTIELSQRTIYRRLDKFVRNGIVVRKSNNGKKKSAQFIYESTPKLKLILHRLYNWLTRLIFDESKLKNETSFNIELINEISSIFKNNILPEIKNLYKDIIPDDDLESILNDILERVILVLDNMKIKKLVNQTKLKVRVSESP